MPQGFTNPYPYFESPSSIKGDYWSKVTPDFLKQLKGKFVGLDTTTGKRDVDLAAENLKGAAALTQPGVIPGFMAGQQTPAPATPDYVSPTLDIDQYKQFAKDLAAEQFKSDVKQNLLGLGATGAFGLMALPFTERMREAELNRQLRGDILSPTRQSERNLRLQQQMESSKAGSANLLNALANVRLAAAQSVKFGA